MLEGGHVAVPSPSLKFTAISFKIRTRSSNGLLMYAGRYLTFWNVNSQKFMKKGLNLLIEKTFHTI